MTATGRTRLLLLAAALVSVPATAPAQDRPAVFVHGLTGQGSDWAATADRLRNVMALEPHLPSLPWRQSYGQQADELQAALGDLANPTVAIGHSNGGVVARQWSKHRPLDGIVTIGTPHRGAPIVSRFYQWAGFHAVTPYLLNNVLGAFSISTDAIWVWVLVDEAINWASDFSIWSVVNLAAALGFDRSLPVAGQMQPESNFLAELNSPSNLAREAAAVPNRVGIISVAHNFYWAGPARAAAPEAADAIAIALYAAASTTLFWGSYIALTSSPHDLWEFEQAMALISVAGHLFSVDPLYCRIISRTDMSTCRPNDGVVPDESQRYPGAPNLIIGGNNDGPTHTQEKDQSDEAFHEALFWYLHVPERTAPPPDPPAPAPENIPAPGTPGTLVAGQALNPGEVLRSPDGRFTFTFQGDGNLVLYNQSGAIWASRTVGVDPGMAAMQSDGNFVIYDARQVAVWYTATDRYPGAYLAVQNSGDVVLFSADGVALWRTGTGS